MTLKNTEVIDNFLCGVENNSKNVFSEGNVLYSHGNHYPLCIKLIDGFIINSDSYSSSTSRHKTHLLRALTQSNNNLEFLKQKKEGKYANIILLPTEKMNEVINNKINSINELVAVAV